MCYIHQYSLLPQNANFKNAIRALENTILLLMHGANCRVTILSAEAVREGKAHNEAPGSKEDCTQEEGMKFKI